MRKVFCPRSFRGLRPTKQKQTSGVSKHWLYIFCSIFSFAVGLKKAGFLIRKKFAPGLIGRTTRSPGGSSQGNTRVPHRPGKPPAFRAGRGPRREEGGGGEGGGGLRLFQALAEDLAPPPPAVCSLASDPAAPGARRGQAAGRALCPRGRAAAGARRRAGPPPAAAGPPRPSGSAAPAAAGTATTIFGVSSAPCMALPRPKKGVSCSCAAGSSLRSCPLPPPLPSRLPRRGLRGGWARAPRSAPARRLRAREDPAPARASGGLGVCQAAARCAPGAGRAQAGLRPSLAAAVALAGAEPRCPRACGTGRVQCNRGSAGEGSGPVRPGLSSAEPLPKLLLTWGSAPGWLFGALITLETVFVFLSL